MLDKRTISQLTEELPAVIARQEVPRLLGGIISAKRLANLDSLGLGPSNRFYVGRKVVYRTADLLDWLAARSEELKPNHR